MDYISVADLRIPVVNTAEMREVDRLMIEKYGIQLLQMMENAGRNLAELARRFLDGSISGKQIIVVAGKELSGIPELQCSILKKLPLEKKIAEDALKSLPNNKGDLILDAVIGYSLVGNPCG